MPRLNDPLTPDTPINVLSITEGIVAGLKTMIPPREAEKSHSLQQCPFAKELLKLRRIFANAYMWSTATFIITDVASASNLIDLATRRFVSPFFVFLEKLIMGQRWKLVDCSKLFYLRTYLLRL